MRCSFFTQNRVERRVNDLTESTRTKTEAAVPRTTTTGAGTRVTDEPEAGQGAKIPIVDPENCNQESDAQETVRIVEKEGRKCVAIAGEA
ncbi:hypothetical protein [Brasilonema bromeliae]|uniref:hypothetical protein n=1 Tax=Brasilonema bromeliae TaxID=383615 RepID=UPI001B7CE90E|nr:hypothetical protein [Brasilonema bromeliae]